MASTFRPGGVHPGRGTRNAVALFADDYLELLDGSTDDGAAGAGFRSIAIRSDDLEADVAAMRRRGIDMDESAAGERRTRGGRLLRWRAAAIAGGDGVPFFLIQHVAAPPEMRAQVPHDRPHPNGVLRTDRVYVVTPDVASTAASYGRILGLPVPRIERGTVIKADMAVFNLGPTGLVVAEPAEPGPAAEALGRHGPGPFQVLYRTSSMDAAARWMVDHGLPPPARGVRNTGEQAILVAPEHACGTYIGLVGPA